MNRQCKTQQERGTISWQDTRLARSTEGQAAKANSRNTSAYSKVVEGAQKMPQTNQRHRGSEPRLNMGAVVVLPIAGLAQPKLARNGTLKVFVGLWGLYSGICVIYSTATWSAQ